MAKYLWLTWDGAGNLLPSLSIASTLTKRGHTVTFAGRPEMIARAHAAGFRTIEVTNAYNQLESYPEGPLRRVACYLTSPAVASEMPELVAAESPDVVVVDGMFPAALSGISEFGRPTAIMVHTFVHRAINAWRQIIDRLLGARKAAGFGTLPGLDTLWHGADKIVVTTLSEFDVPLANGVPSNVRHVGPVLDGYSGEPVKLPWPEDDSTPVVVVSFSTGIEQASVSAFQRTLDALAGEPVHVVVTTAGIINSEELNVPPNAVVLGYAAHEPLFRQARLVVTHGGHGTAMRALRHGVPAIFMPAIGHDQPVIAATFQEWGCGLALPSNADVRTIRAAALEILGAPSYQENAEKRAIALKGVDGAALAADELEGLLTGHANTHSHQGLHV